MRSYLENENLYLPYILITSARTSSLDDDDQRSSRRERHSLSMKSETEMANDVSTTERKREGEGMTALSRGRERERAKQQVSSEWTIKQSFLHPFLTHDETSHSESLLKSPSLSYLSSLSLVVGETSYLMQTHSC